MNHPYIGSVPTAADTALAEIPQLMSDANFQLSELADLIGQLHTRLESVMPPSPPEASTGGSKAINSPGTGLGQDMQAQVNRLRLACDSIRNLLNRVAL